MQILDNPAWAALTGPQAALAERYGRSARYPADVSILAGLTDPADPEAWHDLGMLLGPGEEALIAGPTPRPPAGWTYTGGTRGVQLIGTRVRAAADPEAAVLTGADVPEVLDLVERTRPGPFRKRTIELGSYLGIRRDGALIAMAGERMRLPGYTEISAVCTDPAFRGAGLASRLINALAVGIRARGDIPFLHTAADNSGAIRLYEHLGFDLRIHLEFAAYRAAIPR